MDTKGIKTMTETESKKKWVDFGQFPDEPVISQSGKAILLEHPQSSKRPDVWVPISLCRLTPTSPTNPAFDGSYNICVPMWFCLQNSIYF